MKKWSNILKLSFLLFIMIVANDHLNSKALYCNTHVDSDSTLECLAIKYDSGLANKICYEGMTVRDFLSTMPLNYIFESPYRREGLFNPASRPRILRGCKKLFACSDLLFNII